MATLPADKRILHIAAEVAETNDANVPVLLLGLKGESPIIYRPFRLTHVIAFAQAGTRTD